MASQGPHDMLGTSHCSQRINNRRLELLLGSNVGRILSQLQDLPAMLAGRRAIAVSRAAHPERSVIPVVPLAVYDDYPYQNRQCPEPLHTVAFPSAIASRRTP